MSCERARSGSRTCNPHFRSKRDRRLDQLFLVSLRNYLLTTALSHVTCLSFCTRLTSVLRRGVGKEIS